MDISGAYLQAIGWYRKLYIRPPCEDESQDELWLLEKPAYGLVDSGRLWYLTSDDALRRYGLKRDSREYTLYREESTGSVSLIVLAQVDNYIYTGTRRAMDDFEEYLTNRFQVGEKLRNNFKVYGAEIVTDEKGNIQLSQNKQLSELTQYPMESYRAVLSGTP